MKKHLITVLALSLFAIAGCAHKQAATDSGAAAGSAAAATSASSSQAKSAQPAQAASTQGGETLACTKDKDARTLMVMDKDKGCELKYNKEGKDTVAATGKKGHKHCMDARDKIRKKLETSGFTCAMK